MKTPLTRGLKLPRDIEITWLKALVMFGKSQRDPSMLPWDELKRLAMRSASMSMPNVQRLWETFTQERRDLVINLLAGREKTHAYITGFHLVNQFRTWATLERLMERAPALAKPLKAKHIQIIDIGCGSGAVGITIAQWLKTAVGPNDILLEGFDTSGSLLDAARFMSAQLNINFKGHIGLIENANFAIQTEHPIIIGLGYVWNELGKNRAAQNKIMQLLKTLVSSNQPCMIIALEPSDELGAKGAMRLREKLVEIGLTPLYPCPGKTTCPLLVEKRDWCYSELSWEKPVLQKKIEESIGISRSVIGVSSWVFANEPLVRKSYPTENQKVIIGRPTERNGPWGQFNYLLCSQEGLSKIPGQKPPLLKGTLYTDQKISANAQPQVNLKDQSQGSSIVKKNNAFLDNDREKKSESKKIQTGTNTRINPHTKKGSGIVPPGNKAKNS